MIDEKTEVAPLSLHSCSVQAITLSALTLVIVYLQLSALSSCILSKPKPCNA